MVYEKCRRPRSAPNSGKDEHEKVETLLIQYTSNATYRNRMLAIDEAAVTTAEIADDPIAYSALEDLTVLARH